MLQPKNIPEMESALAARGISVPKLCEESGINETTWWRWKTGKLLPRMSTWNRVCEAYDDLLNPPEKAQVSQ